MKKPASVDEYIATFPPAIRGKLRQLRKAIRDSAPDARESISYRMPYYAHGGRLAYFAAFTHHIGLYIPTPVIADHRKELKGYVTAKGTVRFPLDKPIPVRLVKKLIRARLALNLEKTRRRASR